MNFISALLQDPEQWYKTMQEEEQQLLEQAAYTDAQQAYGGASPSQSGAELVSTIGVIFEHILARAAGRQQHDVAAARFLDGALDDGCQ